MPEKKNDEPEARFPHRPASKEEEPPVPTQLPVVPLAVDQEEKDLVKLERDTLKDIQKILRNHNNLESDIGANDVTRYWSLKGQYRTLVSRPNRTVPVVELLPAREKEK